MKGAAGSFGPLFLSLLMILCGQACLSPVCLADGAASSGFVIMSFSLTGNTVIPAAVLEQTVAPFTGPDRTAEDVEKARDALETLYHDAGYPAVLVNIPEQTVADGIVRLEVIESRIGQVRVSGNRYHTQEMILESLPGLARGEILYAPRIRKELGRLNRSADLKVEPLMTPGKSPGTIDIELKAEDSLPLHGSLELNNRASQNTRPLRLNGMLRYDNLWQKGHSVSLQYQMTPQSLGEVEAISGSYLLPAPWNGDHQWALYGILSDSDTAFGEGFKVVGKGEIFGTRYVLPLPPYRLYSHSLTLGVDYKDFKETLSMGGGSGSSIQTPIAYFPLSFSYSAALQDDWGGVTQFSGGLNLSFRGILSRQSDFAGKRSKASANYLYATAGVQRLQKLPWGMGLYLKLDGQAADQPLIANEQYTAGGMESVRGYRESEAMGDDALHGTAEWSFPDPLGSLGIGKRLQMIPYLFWDAAYLSVQNPQAGQEHSWRFSGTGFGLRGSVTKNLEYQVDWGVALDGSSYTCSGDQSVHFRLKALF